MFNLAVEIARRFSELLDQRRYEELAAVLDPDCVYEFRDEKLQGVQNIIETYRANTEWGFDVFDRVEFESEVFPESNSTAKVQFVDRLSVGDADHRHECEQIVMLNETEKITRIVHRDLPGESEALNEFMRRCGLSRPT